MKYYKQKRKFIKELLVQSKMNFNKLFVLKIKIKKDIAINIILKAMIYNRFFKN